MRHLIFLTNIFIAAALLLPGFALAQEPAVKVEYCQKTVDGQALCRWTTTGECEEGWTKFAGPCRCPDGEGECVPLDNPLTGERTNWLQIMGAILRVAISIVGALALLMIVWGGAKWLTSRGSPEKVKEGTQAILWAVIGLVLVFASYFIITQFFALLTGQR